MITVRAIGGRKGPALALAAAASLLELGPIAALLRSNAGLMAILLAGLAYQIGNALPRPPASIGAPPLFLVLTCGALAMLLVEVGDPGWFVAVGVFSWSLQGMRRRFGSTEGDDLPSTAQKRTARVVGFVLATALPAKFWIPAVWLTSIAPLVWRASAAVRSPTGRTKWKVHPLEVIMILHQSHYFSYCYALPLLFDQSALGGTPFVGTWFACGWVSYLLAEAIWQRFSPMRTFLVGHVCLAVLLVAMAIFAHFPWFLVVLWILSGLGGGTVYCLTILHRAEGRPHRRLEVTEDVGHLLGVLVSVGAVTFLTWNVDELPALGAVWATTAAAGMLSLLLVRRAVDARNSSTSRGKINAR